jgi:tetratricopeptide (TPR) repeat protein
LGVALARAKQYREAVEQFERAIELGPNYVQIAQVYDALARSYSRLGRPADAIAAAEKALELARSTGQSEFALRVDAWLTNYRSQQADQPAGSPPHPTDEAAP